MHWPNPGRLVLLGLCASAWQLPPRSLTQRTRNSRHSSRLVPATYSSSSDDDVVDGGESPGFVILSRPFSLTDMLMQRAIQTQKHYYMELHNEPMSNWLGGFMDHSHLDRGSRWHSCMGLRTGLQRDSLSNFLTKTLINTSVLYPRRYGLRARESRALTCCEGSMQSSVAEGSRL